MVTIRFSIIIVEFCQSSCGNTSHFVRVICDVSYGPVSHLLDQTVIHCQLLMETFLHELQIPIWSNTEQMNHGVHPPICRPTSDGNDMTQCHDTQ